jgi:tetratricopeptide (TPR) repeat protein
MAKKKQSKLWVDPRNIRPADWHPPKMTEKYYSRLFAAFEGVQKNILIAGHLSTLHGAALTAYQCHLFYTDNLSPSILLGNHWSPWHPSEEVTTSIRALLPHVAPDVQALCEVWLRQIQILDELNQEWANALAKFFSLTAPKSDIDFQVLRDHVERYRKEKGAAWLDSSEFQRLVRQLDLTVTKMQQLTPKLDELIQTMHSEISPDEIQAFAGDQRVKDRIETSRDESNHKRAINILNRTLQDSPTQIQASEIYRELGFRYAELGEISQAIENYTKSIELEKLPDPLVYFWRGELYYRQQEWKKAKKDFEQAVELEIYTPEREQASQYISELQSK